MAAKGRLTQWGRDLDYESIISSFTSCYNYAQEALGNWHQVIFAVTKSWC